jgi:ribonuclease PH
MKRADGRGLDEMRPVRIRTGVQKDPEGSVEVAFGDTIVICAASIAEGVPRWLAGQEQVRGWITAEYAMLPGATPGRSSRRGGGRAKEIQRLVGRSLRAAADLTALGECTVTVDCDVLQADGGTRTASITGGYVALALALRRRVADGKLEALPPLRPVVAVSAGLLGGDILLDPDYGEDSRLDVDMNFVLAEGGRIVEVQGTAEGEPFLGEQLGEMLSLAQQGARKLFDLQREALEG